MCIYRTDAVLGNTFQLPSSAFQNIEHLKTATVIGAKQSSETNRGEARDRYPNKFKFNAEDMSPPLTVPEGSAKTVTKRFWPILEDSKF
jgi:oxalate decarboxylase